MRVVAILLLAGLLLMCLVAFWLRFRNLRQWWRSIDVYEQEDRRRRGLCIKCGYDLTGNVSGACPECGTPAPVKREPGA